MAGVVLSSLHQRVKFVVDGKMVTIFAQEDFLLSKPADTQYIDVGEDGYPALRISNAARMMEKLMLREGYVPGMGLGEGLHGMIGPLTLPSNDGRFS